MSEWLWFLLAGATLLAMAAGVTVLRRLPLSTAIVYLGAGFCLGPSVADVARLGFATDAALIERAAEGVILLSLFSTGLKLRASIRDAKWSAPLRLATLAMLTSIALVAAFGILALGLPPPAALLLGAALAPTDHVLAGDVQVEHAYDRDRLRFALSGEAGLNDGAAFPFVLLALGLMGHHPLGPSGLRWLSVDLVWSLAGGLAIGAVAGRLTSRAFVALRSRRHEGIGLDDFVALGLIATAFGLASAVGASGFLAVFAAGLALRAAERRQRPDDALDEHGLPDVTSLAVAPSTRALGGPDVDRDPIGKRHPATDPAKSAAYLAAAVLGFNTQLERIAEVLIVAAAGVLLSTAVAESHGSWWPAAGAAAFVLVAARPVAVMASAIGSPGTFAQRSLAAWFGLRGVGTIFYVAYAVNHGFDATSPIARTIERATLVTVAASIVLHGVTVTPAMMWYTRRCEAGIGDRATDRAPS